MFNYQPGKYRLKIVAAALGETKGGRPQIGLTCAVLSGRDKESGEAFELVDPPNRTVYLALTDGTLGTPEQPGWVWQTLLDLGFQGPSFSDLTPLVGQVRDGEMKVEPYEGKPQERWELYRQGSAVKPASVQVAKSVDTQFSRLLKGAAAGAKNGSAPAPQQQRQAAPRQTVPDMPDEPPLSGRKQPEEDIPF